MNLEILNEGDKVILGTVSLMEETEFVTRVEKISENTVTVLSPICKGAILRVPENSRVDIVFFSEEKIFKSKGISTGNFKTGNFHLTEIEIKSKVERFERRNYYRLSTMNPIRIIKTDSEKVISGKTLDLSGGGMQIKSEEKLNRGEKLLIELDLKGEFLELDSEVVSIVEGINSKEEKYGIKFVDIGEKVRDKIISYIFSIQRDRMRSNRK